MILDFDIIYIKYLYFSLFFYECNCLIFVVAIGFLYLTAFSLLYIFLGYYFKAIYNYIGW